MADGHITATYGYLTNSGLVNSLTLNNGTAQVLANTKLFDKLDRLRSTTWTAQPAAGPSVVSSHAYTYNAANQRTRADLADGTAWTYTYDALSNRIN